MDRARNSISVHIIEDCVQILSDCVEILAKSVQHPNRVHDFFKTLNVDGSAILTVWIYADFMR